jgi:hypothetical protein
MADQEALGTLVAKLAVDLADLKKGLQDGRGELQSFKSFSADLSAQVKKALTFTIGILGIGALLGELKSLLQGVTEVGAKLETTRLAAYAVGQNFGYTSASIDKLVTDLKQLKISSVEGYEAVSNFISHGLDPRQLTVIAQAARDLAVAAGKSPQEMFSLLIDSIVTGTPRALRQAKIPLKEFQDTVLAEGKNLDENLKLSAQERSQVMIDLILKYAQTVEGVSQSTSGAYSRQLGQIKYAAAQARELLWDFMQPFLSVVTGEKIKVWSDLLGWLTRNRVEMQQWGKSIGEVIRFVWQVINGIVGWIAANGELVKTLLALGVTYKLAGYVLALGAAVQGAAAAIPGLITSVKAAEVAFGGWLVVLTQVLIGLAALGAYQFLKNPVNTLPGGERHIEWGGHGITELPSISKGEPTPGSEGEGHETIAPSPQEQAAKLEQTIQAAMQKYKDLMGEKQGAGKGGKGGKEEDPFGEYLKLLDQQRQAEIQAAQDSLKLLKATNEAKKAELEKALAEGLIDGQTYYQRLQELQQEETAAALALIEQKKQAQEQAYQDAIAGIERQELSPEVAETRKQVEAAKNRMVLSQLEADAARTRLEGEKKVTEELKRQVEVRKQYQQKTEDLNLETDQILGLISEQEGKLQKLYLEWQRAKEEAIKAGGYTPEYAAALDRNYRAKALETSSLWQKLQAAGQIFVSAFGDLANTLWQGGVKIGQALDAFGKKLLQDAFKMFFEDLGKAIIQGIKSLAAEIATSLQGTSFGGIGSWLGKIFGSFSGGNWSSGTTPPGSQGEWTPSAHGNVFSQGLRLAAFGSGGVFTRPTIFPMADGGLGMAGEEGEEAILPLGRIRGDLEVKAVISGAPKVTVINNTGVEASPTVSQGDDGDLIITLDKALAANTAKGGKLKQVIQAIARNQI